MRRSSEGTHRGEVNGIAPTGEKITVTGIAISPFAGHKLVDSWVHWDAFGLLEQLGRSSGTRQAKGAAQSALLQSWRTALYELILAKCARRIDPKDASRGNRARDRSHSHQNDGGS